MQSKQEQQEQPKPSNHQQLSSRPAHSQHNEYGWLSAINFIAIAIFAVAFLVIDHDQRWLCAIAIFFCFIFTFVLQALNNQQKMIRFQQRQIQDLLASQNLKSLQQQSQSVPQQSQVTEQQVAQSVDKVIDSDVQYASQSSEQLDNFIDQPIHHLKNNEEIPQDITNEKLILESATLTNATLDNTLHQKNRIQQQNTDEHDLAQVTSNSAISTNETFPENSFEPPFSESPSVKQSSAEHDSSLLKDLKGMTSLWSAFVDWFKGGNSIVRIAIIILLIGVVLLLRFASEYWQPTLGIKMVGIAVAGVVMAVVGYHLRHKRYGYAISVQGAGLGVLFLVLFSAFKLAVIISVGMSYGLLIVLLAVTLLLALRQNALILAFIALGSGFVAPFILNTGSNNIPALFSYYLVLNIALAVIAFFKPWRILNTISLLATFGVGGLSIWMKAQPEQYSTLMLLVWLHFILYLFISIRYSLNISKYKIAFKNIPLIDTALIFATPFMAFTLYAGLVYNNHSALSLASAVLALVYFVIGYVLHKKYQSLTLLIQSFYGLGLTFFALVLPFAFNAQWTSTGWAVQAIALIWIGCRHHLRNSLLFGLALLGLSTASWLKSIFVDGSINLLAVLFLSLSYVATLYIFSTPQLDEPIQEDENESSAELLINRKKITVIGAWAREVKVACFAILQCVLVVYAVKLYQLNSLSHNATLMLILTTIFAITTWRLLQLHQQISKDVQVFAGCALFYLAMVPLMLWQADIISIWWTVQAIIMLIVTCIYAIPSIRHGASLLIVASTISAIVAVFYDESLRYVAFALLVIATAINAYWLYYKTVNKSVATDRTFAWLNIIISFLFIPYLGNKFFNILSWNIFSVILPMLLWWGILTIVYKSKQKLLDHAWLNLTLILLVIGTLEIAVICTFNVSNFQLWKIASQYSSSILTIIVLWIAAFVFCLKVFATQLNRTVAQILMLIVVVLMALFGGILAWNPLAYIPLLLLFPVVILLASLKLTALRFLQPYWIRNVAIAGLSFISLWAVSLLHDGHWNFAYITLLNPIDLLSFCIFIVMLMAIKPVLEDQSRELKIASMAAMILTGLMLISSIMLRSLHHYFQLPYWSVQAWQNGVVQASLTILWVILALILTTFSSRKALRHVWMLGIAVLALVIAKLIFLDLSHTHTITRIISFIGSGLVMLVIGYFAPLPPSLDEQDKSSKLS